MESQCATNLQANKQILHGEYVDLIQILYGLERNRKNTSSKNTD